MRNILLAAGGTGGHVFPAIATAEELQKRGFGVYFATDVRGKKYLKDKGFEYKIITSDSPSGSYFKRAKAFAKICVGTLQTCLLIAKIKPAIVVGFGGYPSFPPLLAASINGIVTVLHEQNSVLGKANRFLGRYCSQVATSFPDTKNLQKGKLVGNPVRAEIIDLPYPVFDGKINVLITGGSQGAKLFSSNLPDVLGEFNGRIKVVHQVRDEEIGVVKEIYAKAGVEAEVSSFFNDIPKRLGDAHLVICRSGASTVFELAKAGRPGLFVPLKISAENHQFYNAESVVKTGGGWLLMEKDFNKEQLSAILSELFSNPAKLAEAAEKIKSFGLGNAAENLADLVEELIK